MRYLVITYIRRPNGKIDETLVVSKNIRPRDHQMANIILDFKHLKVLKSVVDGNTVPKDWDKLVSYYHQHYANVIERLFKENGFEIEKTQSSDSN